MTDILVLSVGNSPEPLIQCISRMRPERAVFLCSEDTQAQVSHITSSVRLPSFDAGRDLEVLHQRGAEGNEIDQLHTVYSRCRALLDRLRHECPGARIAVDYTGGTKTMATGLGLAAVDDGKVELFLTTIERRQAGSSSVAGNSKPIQVDSGAIQVQRLLADGLNPLLNRHDYAAAQTAISAVLRMRQQESTNAALQKLEDLLLALDAWDRWDLERAQSLLKDHGSDPHLREALLFPLQRVMQSRDLLLNPASPAKAALKKGAIHGLEAVEDLLLNAQRRAAQERYDDAVGRLYRSMELTVQLLLVMDHGGIRTGDLDVQLLPEDLRATYEPKRSGPKNTIQLGLADSYDLLAALGHPVGQLWAKQRAPFVDALKTRNHSLLAHGFTPVSFSDWQQLDQQLGGFLRGVVAGREGGLQTLKQLPATVAELEMAPKH
jgi:CRISPR-associated protein (TIGR02710 family)